MVGLPLLFAEPVTHGWVGFILKPLQEKRPPSMAPFHFGASLVPCLLFWRQPTTLGAPFDCLSIAHQKDAGRLQGALH